MCQPFPAERDRPPPPPTRPSLLSRLLALLRGRA